LGAGTACHDTNEEVTMPKPVAATAASLGDVPPAAPEYTAEEGRKIFDAAARRHLGMSGDEFLRRWDAGEFADDPDRPEVIEVALMVPLVR
jgi:hypothetical protein